MVNGGEGPILLKKSVSNLRFSGSQSMPLQWPSLFNGVRLGEGLASVSAWPAFGGFGRLLREETHRGRHLVLLV